MYLVTPIPLVSRRKAGAWLLAAALAVVAGLAFDGFIRPWSLSFVLGLAALPFSMARGSGRGFSRGAFVIGLLFLLLTLLVPVRTLLFFGFGGLVACGAGLLGYRFRLLTLWNWVLLSPMFAYLTNIFSFPIRLQLALACGRLFEALSVPVAIRGNVLEDSQGRFSIDPGCMGLNMLVASLLLGVLLVGYYERRLGRRLGAPALVGYVALLVLLNVGSNLVRILLLVWFVWLPGTLMHELAGLLCLALYVGLPGWWLARRWVRRAPVAADRPHGIGAGRGAYGFALLCALFVLAAVKVLRGEFLPTASLPAGERVGAYRAGLLHQGIVKLTDGKHLVYVKFVRGFYDLEHNPAICWTGSGYTFSEVREATIDGVRIYTAQLVQGSERLHTAWWYSDGSLSTNSQWTWRRQMLRGGSRFAVVNVTAASAAGRDAEVTRLLRGHTLRPLFLNP